MDTMSGCSFCQKMPIYIYHSLHLHYILLSRNDDFIATHNCVQILTSIRHDSFCQREVLIDSHIGSISASARKFSHKSNKQLFPFLLIVNIYYREENSCMTWSWRSLCKSQSILELKQHNDVHSLSCQHNSSLIRFR